MGFWHKREKRLEKKAARKVAKAARKQARATKAAANGNMKRAARLELDAEKLIQKANQTLFWDRVVVEQKDYCGTEEEIGYLNEAIATLREVTVPKLIEELHNMNALSKADQIKYWNDGIIGEVFGGIDNHKHIERLNDRCALINDTLCNRTLFIVLKPEGKKYAGKATPTGLNRPLSKNVRIKLNLPHHKGPSGVRDTIVHEIAHTFNTVTKHTKKSDDELSVGRRLRLPDFYGDLYNHGDLNA